MTVGIGTPFYMVYSIITIIYPIYLIRLTDFGTSKKISEEANNMTVGIGTPFYMVYSNHYNNNP